MDNGFRGATTFLFATPITLTPGVPYYFEPLELPNTGVPPNNGPWNAAGGQYNYPGGSGYLNGDQEAWDYWFREGIVVPEPSSVALLALGGAVPAFLRRVKPPQSLGSR